MHGGDQRWQQGSNSLHNNLRYYLINSTAQVDWSILTDSFKPKIFRDEGNKSLVKVLRNFLTCEHSFYSFTSLLFEYMSFSLF